MSCHEPKPTPLAAAITSCISRLEEVRFAAQRLGPMAPANAMQADELCKISLDVAKAVDDVFLTICSEVGATRETVNLFGTPCAPNVRAGLAYALELMASTGRLRA